MSSYLEATTDLVRIKRDLTVEGGVQATSASLTTLTASNVVVNGTIQSTSTISTTDSIRSHCLPSDAMILIDANGIFPANQNQGSYAMIETVTGAVPAITGSVPVTTQSPFADIYKEGSVWFNGTAGNYITTSLTGYVPSGGLTFEAWVYYTSFTNADSTIGFHNPVGAGAAGNLSIGVNSSGVLILTYNASTVITPTANATLTLNTWNHIAFSYDGTTIRLFLNGVAVTLTSTTLTTTIVGNLTVGQFNSLATSAYAANVRVVTGAALYTVAFTVPAAPLGLAATGTTRFLMRAGQNVPTVQSGALVFDRGLKQFLNLGPQTFNIVTQGFTAIWRGAFTGTAGNNERIFEFGPTNTSGGSCIVAQRNATNATVTLTLFPTNSATAAGSVTTTGTLTQGTSYVIVFRYSYTTQIADIWINGVSNNSASITTASMVGDRTASFTYVGRPSDSAPHTSMTTSTFATYNRALTDSEIVNATVALLDTPVLPNNSTLEIGNLNGKPALSIAGDGRVNVQRLGQTSALKAWPPAAMTGYVTVINGGTYVASASSDNSATPAWNLFDKSSNVWYDGMGSGGQYNTSPPYNYIGALTTNDVNGTVYKGVWFQIQMSSPIVLSSYSFTGVSTGSNTGVWSVLGSRDGIIWVMVDQRNHSAFASSNGPFTFQVSMGPSFTYWRTVTTSLSGATGYHQMVEWTLYGTADTQQPLEIAQPTTMKYPLIAPQITGPQNAGVYVPQDFSSSALNVPAYVVGSVPGSSMGPFAGEGSLYFNGTTTNYVSFPSSVSSLNYDIFSGDFTIEMWVFNALKDVNQNTILNRTTPGNYGDWVIFQQGALINFGINQAATYINQNINANNAARAPTNQWYHLAITMTGSTIRIFVNGNTGNLSGTAKPTTSYTSGGSLNVGTWTHLSTGKFIGNITNLRIIRGAALYTTSFTPPTSPLQPIQGVTQAGTPYGTVLLLRNAPAPGRVLTQRFAGANSSSVLAFPPGPMTGYSTTINAGYGQGVYVASASSENSVYLSWKAFDKSNSTVWLCAGSKYSTTTPFGALVAAATTIDVNGNSYLGEWIQFQMPISIVLSNYTLKPDQSANFCSIWYVFGSCDGTNWYLVNQQNIVGINTSYMYTVTSSQAFTYYRLVATAVSGSYGGTVGLVEWVLNGTIESVNITADGRVGLGVVAPVEALEVAGNMVVNGNMSAGNMGMFRNRIINGDMRIDQRNNGVATTTTGVYKLDRWTCLHGGGTLTGSVRRVNLTSADAPYNIGFINAIESTVSQTGGVWGVYFMFQRIEGTMIYDIVNQPITVSFWAKGNSAFNLVVDVDRTVSGAGGDRTSKNVSITTSWTYYTLTWAIPSPAVTISASTFTSDYLDLNFTCGLNISNYILTCTGVQLEKGTRATPFEFRPYGAELQLCQRYYQLLFAPGTLFREYVINVCRKPIRFAVDMRSFPTVATYIASGTGYASFGIGIYSTYNGVLDCQVIGAGNAVIDITGFSVTLIAEL